VIVGGELRPKDKTFAPRRYEGTEKKKLRWVPFGPLVDGWISAQEPFDISHFSQRQKNEVTEVLRSNLFCHSEPRSGEEPASCWQRGSREFLPEGGMNALQYRDAHGIMIMLEADVSTVAVIAFRTIMKV